MPSEEVTIQGVISFYSVKGKLVIGNEQTNKKTLYNMGPKEHSFGERKYTNILIIFDKIVRELLEYC